MKASQYELSDYELHLLQEIVDVNKLHYVKRNKRKANKQSRKATRKMLQEQ